MKRLPGDIDRLFHALGDPTRRAILDRLCIGPVSVTRLAGPLNITVTAVAQHLQILEECDLVSTRWTESRFREIALAPEPPTGVRRRGDAMRFPRWWAVCYLDRSTTSGVAPDCRGESARLG